MTPSDDGCGPLGKRGTCSELSRRVAGTYRTVAVPVGVRTKPGHVTVQCEDALIAGVGKYRDLPVVSTRTSLVEQADHGDRSGTTWCTDHRPTAAGSLFVDCAKPHLAQATDETPYVDATGDRYPAAAIKAHGQDDCRATVKALPGSRAYTTFARYWNEETWRANGQPKAVPGACWYFRTDHRDLPALGGA